MSLLFQKCIARLATKDKYISTDMIYHLISKRNTDALNLLKNHNLLPSGKINMNKGYRTAVEITPLHVAHFYQDKELEELVRPLSNQDWFEKTHFLSGFVPLILIPHNGMDMTDLSLVSKGELRKQSHEYQKSNWEWRQEDEKKTNPEYKEEPFPEFKEEKSDSEKVWSFSFFTNSIFYIGLQKYDEETKTAYVTARIQTRGMMTQAATNYNFTVPEDVQKFKVMVFENGYSRLDNYKVDDEFKKVLPWKLSEEAQKQLTQVKFPSGWIPIRSDKDASLLRLLKVDQNPVESVHIELRERSYKDKNGKYEFVFQHPHSETHAPRPWGSGYCRRENNPKYESSKKSAKEFFDELKLNAEDLEVVFHTLPDGQILVKTYQGYDNLWLFDKELKTIADAKFVSPSKGPTIINSIEEKDNSIIAKIVVKTDRVHCDYDGRSYTVGKDVCEMNNIVKLHNTKQENNYEVLYE
jgi:hypothetical protein